MRSNSETMSVKGNTGILPVPDDAGHGQDARVTVKLNLRLNAVLIFVVSLFSFSAAFAQPTAPGRFGQSLHIKSTFGEAAPNPIYTVVPITVECFAKLDSKNEFTILVANEPKNSGTHWEVYSYKSSGVFSAYLPAYVPAEIKSTRDITDGKWHHLAMVFDGNSVQLFVDAEKVADQKVEKVFKYPDTGPLTIGHIQGQARSGEVWIDEVRISRIARPIDKALIVPFVADADTIGLWHFEGDGEKPFEDSSTTRNPVSVQKIKIDLPGEPTPTRTRWQDMDFGPFFTSTLGAPYPPGNITYKGISIRLGKDKNAAICFDTDLLRVSCAWTGNFVKIYPAREGLAQHPDVAGTVAFGTFPVPGWSIGEKPDFADPRPDKLGPLPREVGHYQGLYVRGDDVILSYTIGETQIKEYWDAINDEGRIAFIRYLNIGPHKEVLQLRMADIVGGKFHVDGHEVDGFLYQISNDRGNTRIVDPEYGDMGMIINNISLEKLSVRFEPAKGTRSYRIKAWFSPDADLRKFESIRIPDKKPDFSDLFKGGPPRYPQAVFTKGVLGKETGPYAVDTLTAPDDNPWKSFLRFSGHDFFSNGDLAVCSISGDVWIVSGIDDKLENLKWRRFATGLHQPLGLKILKDKIYVLGRDQITRLHDLNSDGEADFYENFNNQCKVTDNGHSYACNLEADPQGNLYYTKCGDNTEHGGTLLRVLADGSKLDVFATGLRNPNGLGVSPDGQVFEADNQGEWTPASRLDLVKPGMFLGYVPMSHQKVQPTDPGKPLCWMPQNCDNSSASQTWVTSDNWGLPRGEIIHTSYGAAAIYHVMHETVNGQIQGGVYRFPLSFATGIMRARFSPKDGQLYVSGLKGWQTAGSRDGALQRVRYTGKSVQMPAALHIRKNGIELGFTTPLDPKTAADPDSYSILQWNYHWTAGYGSAQWSIENPKKQGYDTVEVKSAKLLADGKTVFLEIPAIQPVMQMQIGYSLNAVDGADMKGEIYNTIHERGLEK